MKLNLNIKSKALWVFVFALTVRFAYLTYNLSLHIPDGWSQSARAGLYYAQVLAKTPPAEMVDKMNFKDAHVLYLYDENGLVFIHYAIAKIFGKTSFRYMQLLQLSLDAILIFPTMWIGNFLGGKRAAIFSGMAYAIFIPEIWMAANPSYDFWASLGLLSATWLYLKGAQKEPVNFRRSCVYFVSGTYIVSLTAIVRSTVVFFPFVFLFLFFLISKISLRHKALLSMAVVGTWFFAMTPKLVQNYSTYGQFRVVRNTRGHNFWIGVGQFSNPYGVLPSDISIQDFYFKLSGKSDVYNPDYEKVLLAKAHEYITRYPFHYLSHVALRSVSILSGLSMRCAGLYADVNIDAPGKGFDVAEAQERGAIRRILIQKYGGVWGNALYLCKNPMRLSYAFLLLMPTGLFFALLWDRRGIMLLAVSPMIYTLATLSPFDYTGRNVISAYTAILPVCALGLLKLYDYFFPGVAVK